MIITKRNWFKRSLSLLLVVIMLLSMSMVSGFATEEKSQREEFNDMLVYIDGLNPDDYTESSYQALMKLRGYIKDPDSVPDAYLGNYMSQLQQYIDNLVEAEKSDNDNTLEDGTYVVTLNSVVWNDDKVSAYRDFAVPMSSRALLEVKNGRTFVTVQTKNSAYLEYAWMLDQKLNEQYPKVIDKTGGADIRTDSMGTDMQNIIKTLSGGEAWLTTNSENYIFSETNNGNYHSLQINDSDTDKGLAYITFELTDYTKKFFLLLWSEIGASDGSDTPGASSVYMQLDVESIFSLDDLKSGIANGSVGVLIDDAQRKNYSVSATSVNQEFAALFFGTAETTSYDSNVNAVISLAYKQLKNSPVVSIDMFTKKEYTDSNYKSSPHAGAVYGISCYEEGENTATVSFDENELIYGVDIKVDTETTISGTLHYFGTIVLFPKEIKNVTIVDSGNDDTGIYVTGKDNVLPEDAILTIDQDRAYTEYPETSTYTRDGIIEWSGTMYNEPKHWFYIQLTDKDGNDLPSYDGITLHIPLEKKDDSNPAKYYICAFHSNDGMFFNTDNYGNDEYGSVKKMEDGSYEFQYVNQLAQINIQRATFAYMQPGDYADIRGMVKSGDDDGIYIATAQLQKIGTKGSSMANAALNSDVMITIHNGEAKLYFTSSYLTIMQQKAYIGELFCYDEDTSGVWFADSVVYTDFLTDENGKLVSNCGYDPIKDCGCVEGGIVTLMDESYDSDKGCYNLAIVPPAMLGGVEYNSIQKDELTVHLRVTDIKKLSDYSEENLDTYVIPDFHFDKSAVLREIEYAKIFDEKEYTKESYKSLTEAVATAETVYETAFDDVVVASKTYEAQIELIKAAVANLEESTELTDAKDKLKAQIDIAKEIVIGDKTENAFVELQEAIAAAEAVYNNTASNISDLNEATEYMKGAVAAFGNSESASELDKDNLEDGVYSVYVDMIKMDRESKSMADNAINHIVKLEVINGEYFVTLNFRGITIENRFGYLKNLSYYENGYTYGEYGTVNGILVSAEVLATQKDEGGNDVIDQYNDEESLYPDITKIKLVSQAISDEDGYIPLHVFVPIMEAIAEGNGDQDVLMKIDWTSLKKTTEDDEVFKPEDSVEQSPAVDITDKETGVKVHADKGVFEDGIKLIVIEITSGANYDKATDILSDIGGKFKLYEIHFEDENGNEVQPNGTVTVSYPIQDGYNAEKFALYRINEDGSKTLVKGVVKDGFYEAITKSFSMYALVEKGSAVTDIQNTQNNAVQTGDNVNIMIWFMLAAVGIISVVFCSKKKIF